MVTKQQTTEYFFSVLKKLEGFMSRRDVSELTGISYYKLTSAINKRAFRATEIELKRLENLHSKVSAQEKVLMASRESPDDKLIKELRLEIERLQGVLSEIIKKEDDINKLKNILEKLI